jgi:hypothetical protein
MKISTFSILAGLGLVASTVAEDLLFIDSLKGQEYNEASATDGFTVKAVTPAQWSAMTTMEFAAYKAIIFADQYGGADAATLQLIEDTKAVWSPAVTGNMIIIGKYETIIFCSNPKTNMRKEPIPLTISRPVVPKP